MRQFQMPYGNQFVEDKTFGRIFLMAGGGNHDWHFIYTDGRRSEVNFAATTTILCIMETREANGKGIRWSSIPKGSTKSFGSATAVFHIPNNCT